MRQPRLEHHPIRMWVAVVLAIAYGWLIISFGTLSGSNTVDGIIGVLLGCYICAHPAARALDLLYLPSVVRQEYLASEAGVMWLWASVLVSMIGVATVFVGANRFVQPAYGAPALFGIISLST